MKVRELMAALAQHNPEAEVLTEGCDCWGDTDAVLVVTGSHYAETGPHVIIVREGRDTDYDGYYDDPNPPKDDT